MHSSFARALASVLACCIGLAARSCCVARPYLAEFTLVGVEAIVDLAVAVVVELVFADLFGGEDLALAIGPFAVDAEL